MLKSTVVDPVFSFSALKILDLSANQIRAITANTFSGLSSKSRREKMKDDIKDQYCNRFSKPLKELYRDKTFQFVRKRPIKTKECITFDFICLYYLYIALTVLHSRMFFFVLVRKNCCSNMWPNFCY